MAGVFVCRGAGPALGDVSFSARRSQYRARSILVGAAFLLAALVDDQRYAKADDGSARARPWSANAE